MEDSVGKGCECSWHSRFVWFILIHRDAVSKILLCMSHMKGKANYAVIAFKEKRLIAVTAVIASACELTLVLPVLLWVFKYYNRSRHYS